MINRRLLLKLAGLAPFARVPAAFADEAEFKHAISLFDDIKYSPGFKQFDYVNSTAPKGGRFRMPAYGTFDSLNPYTVNGDPAAVSVLDTLMERSLDEPSTMYGLIAESLSFPDDKSRVVFRLNPTARFHDGKAITPDDVIFSLETLKANLATQAAYYKNVEKVEQTGDHEVTFVFNQKDNRELPSIVAELPVLPKHWWTVLGADGKPRDTNAASLEIPLGSGAYKFKQVVPGSTIILERVPDYWAKDLPVNVGQNNFDELHYLYFQSVQVAFEGFKGDQYDYQYETSSKQWATGYDFPAVTAGKVVKETIALKQVHGMQGYVLNLRKPKFQDIRVRQAMNLAFDFEWSNTNLFYGLYKRSRSFFNNSELEATGLPSPQELALLEPLKDKLPPEVFTTEYQNPTNPDGAARRKNLQAASKLLDAAGWKAVDDGGKRVLKNDKGEVLSVEFVLDSPLFERITLPYKQQLELLGFVVSVRTLDDAQITKLRQTFDYDIIVHSYGQSMSPGNEQRFFWGSTEADKQGSQNYAGIKNEAIDALIEKLIFVKDRKELITACRALDRALIWNSYIIPQWFGPDERIAHWDRFGRPDKAPDYALGVPTNWWWDEERAKKIGG
ncbi:extracellular solute-binding protein [Aestuariivirga litoralis]|uniref:extracellular solute-binding protein n=1 Tax=Aestuariivirga litoralis TaxID=2650924 RepID=UPI0018C68FAF|nr:extracellular solute-binding protein [Aestuariivirga litoralis]MBG1232742.1 ABC transporter substrate-binding protein [Aestuariivirga litoralis]